MMKSLLLLALVWNTPVCHGWTTTTTTTTLSSVSRQYRRRRPASFTTSRLLHDNVVAFRLGVTATTAEEETVTTTAKEEATISTTAKEEESATTTTAKEDETAATTKKAESTAKSSLSLLSPPPPHSDPGDDEHHETTTAAADPVTKATSSSIEKKEEEEPSIVTPKPESARLSKAKWLLEQFATTRNNNNATNTDMTALVSIMNSSSTSMIVPDSYWSNGHLQQDKDYVTRWSQGVNVAEPLIKYDPVVAEQLWFNQPAKWMIRNMEIAFPIGTWALGVLWDYVTKVNNNKARARQLQQALSKLGPAIIKGGQALASRPDLLPSEYLEELQKLQDDVPTFSNDVAFATVERELNIQFDQVFELVQDEPVAAASIGQVYKARLLSNNEIVALKIQRPYSEEIIALDLYILRWWSGIYNRLFRLLNRDIDVQSIIDDFGELIYREIDYVAEAANAQRFNELYAGVTDVFVPKVYSDLTTSKILVMEWVDGIRLTDSNRLNEWGLDRRKLVNTLVQCSLRQILENGFFHADPHAGNLLATRDGRLCYLDFGMMSYAASHQRNGFVLAVVHIVNRDWSALASVYQTLGFIPQGTDLRPIELALERALPDVLNAEISELNFKNVVNKLGDIMYTYPFSLPPFYIAIIRCLGVLEGLAIQVDPQARIIGKAYPYVASRVLTDPQQELQEALKRLALAKDGTSIRWERLESLLKEAKKSSAMDYDVSAALDSLTNYLLTPQGETLLQELSQQLVHAVDDLGMETVRYVVDAARALAIQDEVAAVRAFRSLQRIVGDNAENDDLRNVLPEVPPTMKKVGRLWNLLMDDNNINNDPAKWVPIVRKLVQEPRIQKTANQVVAQIGERALSRGLRAVFGLPPPLFEEERKKSSVAASL